MSRSNVNSCKHGGVSATTIGRIGNDDLAMQYIEGIDFSQLVNRFITNPCSNGGLGWEHKDAAEAIAKYRKWLFLKRKYFDELVPPPWDVHFVWQGHLKDSLSYSKDTSAVFGQYLHHYPFFGFINDADRARRHAAFESNTSARWQELFGETPQERNDLVS